MKTSETIWKVIFVLFGYVIANVVRHYVTPAASVYVFPLVFVLILVPCYAGFDIVTAKLSKNSEKKKGPRAPKL